jgi:hypothetical protein
MQFDGLWTHDGRVQSSLRLYRSDLQHQPYLGVALNINIPYRVRSSKLFSHRYPW